MSTSRAVTAEMTLKIVRALARRPLRFSEIDRAIKSRNNTVLSERLKKMMRDGLIQRRVIKLGPPAHIEYTLTALGNDFAGPASAVIDWTERHTKQIEAARLSARAIADAAN